MGNRKPPYQTATLLGQYNTRILRNYLLILANYLAWVTHNLWNAKEFPLQYKRLYDDEMRQRISLQEKDARLPRIDTNVSKMPYSTSLQVYSTSNYIHTTRSNHVMPRYQDTYTDCERDAGMPCLSLTLSKNSKFSQELVLHILRKETRDIAFRASYVMLRSIVAAIRT